MTHRATRGVRCKANKKAVPILIEEPGTEGRQAEWICRFFCNSPANQNTAHCGGRTMARKLLQSPATVWSFLWLRALEQWPGKDN